MKFRVLFRISRIYLRIEDVSFLLYFRHNPESKLDRRIFNMPYFAKAILRREYAKHEVMQF